MNMKDSDSDQKGINLIRDSISSARMAEDVKALIEFASACSDRE